MLRDFDAERIAAETRVRDLERQLHEAGVELVRAKQRVDGCSFTYCTTCGSRRVSFEVWYYPNEYRTGDDNGSRIAYCDDCENPDTQLTWDRSEAAEIRLSYRREREADEGQEAAPSESR